MLKNVLLFVNDLSRSREFYQDVFGLSVKATYEGNTVLVGGIVLQDIAVWEFQTGMPVNPGQGNTLLYFEEPDMEEIQRKLQSRGIEHFLSEDRNPAGKRFIRFRDPDGYWIEVAKKG